MAGLDESLHNLQNVFGTDESLRYSLMNKNKVLARFSITSKELDARCTDVQWCTDEKLPYYVWNLQRWLSARSCGKDRERVDEMLTNAGAQSLFGFIRVTRCLSMTDTLWIKAEDDNANWEDVSLYYNDGVKASIWRGRSSYIDNLYDIACRMSKSVTYNKFNRLDIAASETTTDGAYLKYWRNRDGRVTLVKYGSAGASNAGLEPYCEVLASQVFEKLCPTAVRYKLAKIAGDIASECDIFTSEEYGYKPYKIYDPFGRPTVGMLMDEYSKYGDSDNFARMIVADSVCVNTDRHFGNFGYLVDNDTFAIKGLNPAFDYNMAFAPYSILDEGYGDFDHYLSERLPVFGRDHYSEAQKLLTPSIRAELINLKSLDLKVECDDKFTEKRLEFMNIIKDTQINRILGNVKMYSFPT